jgi:hypothetical protein
MGAAIDYLTEIGMEAIEEHEHALAAYALERLADVPEVHVFGPPASGATRSRRHSETGRVRRGAPVTEEFGDDVHHRRGLHRHQRSLLRGSYGGIGIAPRTLVAPRAGHQTPDLLG